MIEEKTKEDKEFDLSEERIKEDKAVKEFMEDVIKLSQEEGIEYDWLEEKLIKLLKPYCVAISCYQKQNEEFINWKKEFIKKITKNPSIIGGTKYVRVSKIISLAGKSLVGES